MLVGVLRRKRDLDVLLREQWYRMPVRRGPVRRFDYLAFYEPARFGKDGKRIRYYARAAAREVVRRERMLPDEPRHPRAQEAYWRVRLRGVQKLPRPIGNTAPRRVSFGFTTLKRLLRAKNMLELFAVPPTEEIMARALRHAGIRAEAQKWVSIAGRRYRLDFALPGRVAVECDNRKAHSGAGQILKDKAKDAALRRSGWRVLRFTEEEILRQAEKCVEKIRRAVSIRSGGG